MKEIDVELGSGELPYFAEYPYFVWGEVNYDSDGDCSRPTDRAWTELYLEHRGTGETLEIVRRSAGSRPVYAITGQEQHSVCLAAYLTVLRTSGRFVGGSNAEDIASRLQGIDARLAAADRVAEMFTDPALAKFDAHDWWAGWKWVGEFSSDLAADLRKEMLRHQGSDNPPATDT